MKTIISFQILSEKILVLDEIFPILDLTNIIDSVVKDIKYDIKMCVLPAKNGWFILPTAIKKDLPEEFDKIDPKEWCGIDCWGFGYLCQNTFVTGNWSKGFAVALALARV